MDDAAPGDRPAAAGGHRPLLRRGYRPIGAYGVYAGDPDATDSLFFERVLA
jgi:hypothetical protein